MPALSHDPSGRGCAIAGRVMRGDATPTNDACEACLTDNAREDLIWGSAPDRKPCGCSLRDGACDVHSAMLGVIHRTVFDRADETGVRLGRIWGIQDGYGEPGFTPPQGFDWSGIRDSSTETIEAMWKEAIS